MTIHNLILIFVFSCVGHASCFRNQIMQLKNRPLTAFEFSGHTATPGKTLWRQQNPSNSEVLHAVVKKMYPTKAQEVIAKDRVKAVLLRHILVATEDMAKAIMEQIEAGTDFVELASAVSICEITKKEGGLVGWSAVGDTHLEEIVPKNIRAIAMGETTDTDTDTDMDISINNNRGGIMYKPGDVFIGQSERGCHVVRVDDIFTDLSYRSKPRGGSGVSGGNGRSGRSASSRLRGDGVHPRPLIDLMRGAISNNDDNIDDSSFGSSDEYGGRDGGGEVLGMAVGAATATASASASASAESASFGLYVKPNKNTPHRIYSGREDGEDRNVDAGVGVGREQGEDNKEEGEGEEQKVLYYSMDTMGCQMNQADSERMESQLVQLGFRPLPPLPGADATTSPSASASAVLSPAEKARAALDITLQKQPTENNRSRRRSRRNRRLLQVEKPSVVITNTCSIRDKAEQKVYSYLGEHAARKRRGEDVVIVVAGCVAQQEGEKLLRRVPEIDLVMGPQYSNRLGELLEDVINGNQVVATEPLHIMEDMTKPRRHSEVCAWVNIIYGCNERCTYCVVPTTRGVEQSRPPEAILDEVQDLAASGYREVTLLGQNIDAYGRDMTPKRKFSDLLLAAAEVEGIERVRFVTAHPRYMSDSVVSTVKDHPNICKCFHIPFQSGDNDVLRNMKRGYTRERYLRIVDRIKRLIPDASITADLIVGFPGETDEQFQNTIKLLEEVKFDACMTAAYSPRPNTPAALWDNQVDEEVKSERLQIAQRVVNEHALLRSQRFLGRTEAILVEERNVKVPDEVVGRTDTNRKVFFKGDIEELRGKMVNVKISEIRPYTLSGSMVGEPW